jgi:hypothetical protein
MADCQKKNAKNTTCRQQLKVCPGTERVRGEHFLRKISLRNDRCALWRVKIYGIPTDLFLRRNAITLHGAQALSRLDPPSLLCLGVSLTLTLRPKGRGHTELEELPARLQKTA